MQVDARRVELGGVLDDGEAEAGAAAGLGAALVHAIEALEDAGLVLRGDADAGVGDGEGNLVRFVLYGNGDTSAGAVIFDGVVREIVDDGGQKLGDAGDLRALAAEGDADIGLFRLGVEGVDGLFGDDVEVARFTLHVRRALVQVGEMDDVLNEARHPVCLVVDAGVKLLSVGVFDQTVHQKLRAPGDGVEGRFQLVGDVGGELPAEGLSLMPLRDVYDQHHSAGDLIL